jgi:hypothetical protein
MESIGNWFARFYEWLWFRVEFWLTPSDRRPLTFIFRDWIGNNKVLAAILMTLWFIGMIVLSIWHGTLSTVLTIFSALLTAHLVWGEKWIEHQQECPEYLGEDRAIIETARYTKNYYQTDALPK